LADVKMPIPGQQIVLQGCISAVTDGTERIIRITTRIRELLPSWKLGPVVNALQAMRGVALIVAVTVVAKLGDLKPFDGPRQLKSYLGLVPCEHSSGKSRRTGSIIKAGNGQVRKAHVEAAHSNRLPARISKILLERQAGLPRAVRDIAWKAEVRLCARYRKLVARGMKNQIVICSINNGVKGELFLDNWQTHQASNPLASPLGI
jgi:transposase